MTTLRRLAILVLMWLVWQLFVVPAGAQAVCAARTDIVKNLADKYGEQLSGHGMGSGNLNIIVETFRSEKGTFTVLHSWPNGVSCVVAAGEGWKDIEVKWGSSL
jgi:hypothetical protein